MRHKIIQVEEKVPFFTALPLSIQHLLAMFGAAILVPSLFGINPSIVLLMNGISTIFYLIICKGKVPAFLGSSFAFISPVLLVLGTDKTMWTANYPHVLGGFIVAGCVFVIVSLIIKFFGNNWLKIVLPASVIGPVIALIGLGLGDTAANMAGFIPNSGIYDIKTIVVSSITLLTAIFGAVLLRGFFTAISILLAIVVGYVSAIFFGLVNFDDFYLAHFFTTPNFCFPKFTLNAATIIAPAVFVVISEHIGHFMLTQHIVKKDLLKDPGIFRSLLGNGLFTIFSGLVGSVPTTTYGENISVMAITRVYSVWVIGGAAVLSILISFIGKFAAIIQSIPTAVMGGVSLFLFGIIASSGVRVMLEEKVDYNRTKNLILSSIVLTIGISGTAVHLGTIMLKGMSLATFVGIILSTVFYLLEKFHLTNDQPLKE